MPVLVRAATCLACLFVSGLFVLGLAGGQDGPFFEKAKKEKKDRGEKGPKGDKGGKKDPEEKAIAKSAAKVTKGVETERDKWLKELNKAYPDQIAPGFTGADFAQWFGLLSGGAAEWLREETPTKQLRELFDRAAARLNIGEAASLRRGEFLDYALRFLLPGSSPPWKPPADPLAEADKVFRQLDRDGSGLLEPDEWPDRLRVVADQFDRDHDGRINPDEYRDYFGGRVVETIEFGPDPRPRDTTPLPPEYTGPVRYGRLPNGLPEWFVDLDFDHDGQVALHEWRRAGQPLSEFFLMDLDADGLLPSDEYVRYLRTVREVEVLLELTEPFGAP